MSVVVEGPWVDRRRSGAVAAPHPAVGRHAVLVGAEQPDDARPLVRELEHLVARLQEHGPLLALQSELRSLLAAWAAALVRLHGTPVTRSTPVADVPWVLVEPLPHWLDDLPTPCGSVWAVRAHPAVRRAVDRTRAGWTADRWTHGDPTGDEVEVSHLHGTARATLLGPVGTSSSAPRATGGLGDARWDVATALDWLAVALGPALDQAWHLDPVTTFLGEYRALGGAAVPGRDMAVARTLATAVEWSAQLAVTGMADDEERAWLSGLWSRPLELAGRRHPG